MKLTLVLFAGGVWALFTAAVPFFFRQPATVHPQMRLLGATGLALIALTIAVLVRSALAVEAAVLGAGLYGLALALFLWACRTVGRRRLSLAYCEPGTSELIVSGPYGVIRHPIYTAYSIAWLAGAVAGQSVVLLAAALLMWSLYIKAARQEEAHLTSMAGAHYTRYRQVVGMFVPNLRRSRQVSSQE